MTAPNPMDTLAEEYDQWFDTSEGKELFELELTCVRNVLGAKNGRWLEVGVGTGRFAAVLAIQEGIDPSDAALTIARPRGIEVWQGVAEKLPYSDSSFDGVLLVTTLCFVDDSAAAMREIHRVLKPKGRLVIGMIPADSPWGTLYAEKGRQGHPFYAAAHFHTVQEVIGLAGESGLEFTDASSCLTEPPSARQSKRIARGIVPSAGFVCLLFSNATAIADTISTADDNAV